MALLKRVFDIVCSALGLLVLSPMFIVIAAAIKLGSDGPVFFRQERLTLGGRPFIMLKFRTMYEGAEFSHTGLFNYPDDPRVTRTGLFLRKYSLDELPQLINVLIGDISLVGPRPPVTYELGEFNTLNARYKKRFSVQGGMTGLAQVRGRNENSWDEKVGYDNLYIDLFKKQGLWLDIKILFETVLKVFRHKSIYEEKADASLDDAEASKLAAEEVIKRAHAREEDDTGD